MQEVVVPFAVALALGLLVGFQRERTRSGLGGVRTFPLIALTGALCAHLGRELASVWLVPAGLLALTAFAVMGSVAGWRDDEAPGTGITTEVSVVVVFLIGALTVVADRLAIAVVLGGIVAVLLHFKRPMHGITRRLSEDEVRALMRIVVIGLVILPILPDETYGPYEVLNPFSIWLMVVLIAGISVATYILYRLVSAPTGALLGGIFGGLISSTATTVSYARQARRRPDFASPAAAAIMVASTVLFARILFEVGAVAPALLPQVAFPLGAMAAVNIAICAVAMARLRARSGAPPDQEDPARLGPALILGLLYGAVLFAVAAAKEHFGAAGLYAVAGVSGLTDVDAITLSMANLAEAGRIEADTAWRAILLAALANLVFKGGLAFALGGLALLRAIALLFVPSIAGGLAILTLWP